MATPPRWAAPRPRLILLALLALLATLLPLALTPPTRAATVTVQVGPGNSTTFFQASQTINVGDTVNWTWSSTLVPHSVTSGSCPGGICATDGRFDSGIHVAPFSFPISAPFTVPGSYAYFCEVHGAAMQGVIIVQGAPNPTATATATATATPQTQPPVPQGNLQFVTPVRVLDTRAAPFGPIGFNAAGQPIAAGTLADGSTTRFKLAGQTFGGTALPADLTGVMVNVTLVQGQSTGGFVTVYPGNAGSPPNASTVNPSSAIAANFWASAVAPAGGANAGTIAVTSVGSVRDLAIDLVGYYSPAAPAPTAVGGAGNLAFISPVRVLDTRGAPFGPIGFDQAGQALAVQSPLQAGATRGFRLAGQSFGSGANAVTFPADLSGILAHVTTIQGSGSGGFVTLLPGGTTGTPGTSTVNPSTPIAFNTWATGIPTTGTGAGQFSLYSTNALDVAVDVVGFWAASSPASLGSLSLVTPARVLDTRGSPFGPIGFTPAGAAITAAPLAAGSTTRFKLNGQSFAGGALTVPADVKGVLVNVTLAQGQPGGGFVTVFPGDLANAPNTSTVNPATNIAASFWASGVPTTAPANNGTIAVTSVGDPRDVLIDLVGYFR